MSETVQPPHPNDVLHLSARQAWARLRNGEHLAFVVVTRRARWSGAETIAYQTDLGGNWEDAVREGQTANLAHLMKCERADARPVTDSGFITLDT